MDEHSEYLLQVHGGVFEFFLRMFLQKHALLHLICLYIFKVIQTSYTAKITNHDKKKKKNTFLHNLGGGY